MDSLMGRATSETPSIHVVFLVLRAPLICGCGLSSCACWVWAPEEVRVIGKMGRTMAVPRVSLSQSLPLSASASDDNSHVRVAPWMAIRKDRGDLWQVTDT